MAILRQAELGTPIAELIREVGISEQAFYQWKRKFIGLEVAQAEQVKLMAEENSRIRWTLGGWVHGARFSKRNGFHAKSRGDCENVLDELPLR